MSKATRQTVGLLSIVYGGMVTITTYNLSDDALPTVYYVKDVAHTAIDHYPHTGDWDKHFEWIAARIKQWDAKLDKLRPAWSGAVMAYISKHILEDLVSKIRDPEKRALLDPINEGLDGLISQLDPDGSAFDAMEEADRLLNLIYELMEFER